MNQQQLANVKPGQMLLDGIYQHEVVYVRKQGLFLRTLGSNKTFWIMRRDARKLKLSGEASPTKLRAALVILEKRLMAAGLSRETFANLLESVSDYDKDSISQF